LKVHYLVHALVTVLEKDWGAKRVIGYVNLMEHSLVARMVSSLGKQLDLLLAGKMEFLKVAHLVP
jgi:hypothetical protein